MAATRRHVGIASACLDSISAMMRWDAEESRDGTAVFVGAVGISHRGAVLPMLERCLLPQIVLALGDSAGACDAALASLMPMLSDGLCNPAALAMPATLPDFQGMRACTSRCHEAIVRAASACPTESEQLAPMLLMARRPRVLDVAVAADFLCGVDGGRRCYGAYSQAAAGLGSSCAAGLADGCTEACSEQLSAVRGSLGGCAAEVLELASMAGHPDYGDRWSLTPVPPAGGMHMLWDSCVLQGGTTTAIVSAHERCDAAAESFISLISSTPGVPWNVSSNVPSSVGIERSIECPIGMPHIADRCQATSAANLS